MRELDPQADWHLQFWQLRGNGENLSPAGILPDLMAYLPAPSYASTITAPLTLRLNADGSLDSTWNNTSATNFEAFDLALQSDGRIIVGGRLKDGKTRGAVIRLMQNGGLDTNFHASVNVADHVGQILVTSNDKILSAAPFGPAAVLRLQPDG